MLRILCVSLFLLIGFAPTMASPYWVRWDDGWPEDQGWNHVVSDTPAERWLEDGKLFIDSRADWSIYDIYGQMRPGQMTPGPGEKLVVSWRVKVDEVLPAGGHDPSVLIQADDQYAVSLNLGTSMISSFYEPGTHALFTPHEFHSFTLESADMRTYRLFIDGALGFEGTFFESLFSGAGVGWGDMESAQSLSEWDWFEYGIVPEPSGWGCLLVAAVICRPRKHMPG